MQLTINNSLIREHFFEILFGYKLSLYKLENLSHQKCKFSDYSTVT